jgi:serine/threonine protein kinase
LSIATDRFSDTKKLGEGNFGVVYSGSINNEQVAVKQIKNSNGEFKDFLAERATIAQTRHKNIVKLEGWCCSISNLQYWWSHKPHDVKLFLVYELVANGTLHDHLYEKKALSWEIRYIYFFSSFAVFCCSS